MSTEIAAPVRKVFVVLDPTRMIQPALEKGEWIAERNRAELHLYCCCYDTHLAFDQEAKQATVDRTRAWLDRIAASSRAQGLTVTVDVAWSPEWRDAIAAAASASGADIVVKTANRHTPLARHLMKTADWTLLRSLHCPTLFVSPAAPASNRVVLAAVKVKPSEEVYLTLNEHVVGMGHRIADVLGGELHAVTAYKGEGMYFDRQKFADSCGLPRSRVHAAEGAPYKAIAEVAEQIGAGVLIIGCANGRPGERPTIIGDTAERLIDAVHSDIVVVPA